MKMLQLGITFIILLEQVSGEGKTTIMNSIIVTKYHYGNKIILFSSLVSSSMSLGVEVRSCLETCSGYVTGNSFVEFNVKVGF